jgi:hypothetical protein
MSTRICSVLVVALALAARAEAAWTAMAFLGASATVPARLHMAGSAFGGAVETGPVHFTARSFASPPYYGYRIGWAPAHRAVGVEAELIHLKVYARTADLPFPVQRFSISHGLNLLLGNVVWRPPAGGPVRVAARVGVGVAIPHGESRIAGVEREEYELSSVAMQAAIGPEVVVAAHVRVFAEYKLTTAAPAVTVAGGTVAGRYTTHHATAGLAVAW